MKLDKGCRIYPVIGCRKYYGKTRQVDEQERNAVH
jgi:hypothetical protein